MKHDIDQFKSQLIPIYNSLRDDCNRDDNLCPFLMQWGNRFPITPNSGIIFTEEQPMVGLALGIMTFSSVIMMKIEDGIG